MKTTYTLLTLLVIIILPLQAQIGINIKQYSAVLHFDPKNDTSGTTGTADDIIIDNAGYMGINTIQPKAKLDVTGSMSIVDGSEGNNRVMTSDADGLGTWQRLVYTTKVEGYVPNQLATMYNGPLTSTGFKYTGANITLPKGQWQIYFYCVYNNDNGVNSMFWWDLCTSTTWVMGTGRVLSYFSPDKALSTTYASYAVSPTKTTTYHVFGVAGRPTGNGEYSYTYHSGGRIWAIPIF